MLVMVGWGVGCGDGPQEKLGDAATDGSAADLGGGDAGVEDAAVVDDFAVGDASVGDASGGDASFTDASTTDASAADLAASDLGGNDAGAPSTTVVKSTGSTGGINYVLYAQMDDTGSNRKGILLLGAGQGNTTNPPAGATNGTKENAAAKLAAEAGYIGVVVGYRAAPGSDWNTNAQQLAGDFSTIADFMITKFGSGLSRSKTVWGGVSYTSFSGFTGIAYYTSTADMAGFIAMCGATDTDKASKFKIPVYSVVGTTNYDDSSGLEGSALITYVKANNTNANVKAKSDYFEDPATMSHCGDPGNIWPSKVVAQLKVWVP